METFETPDRQESFRRTSILCREHNTQRSTFKKWYSVSYLVLRQCSAIRWFRRPCLMDTNKFVNFVQIHHSGRRRCAKSPFRFKFQWLPKLWYYCDKICFRSEPERLGKTKGGNINNVAKGLVHNICYFWVSDQLDNKTRPITRPRNYTWSP